MGAFVYDGQGNRYELSEELGRGGQGRVYRVNRSIGRGLAVKAVIDPSTGEILQDKKAYQKYLRQLHRIWALPEAPHLAVPLAPLREPLCGYIMRLMEDMGSFGPCLAPADPADLRGSLCAAGGLRKRLTVLRNLADVLDGLHSRGILYGDLSPGNIFVSTKDAEAEVWLIDVDNLAYENDSLKSIGTPFCRAPEIALGGKNDVLADRYSFALLAYEYLTFSKPFAGSLMDAEAEGEDFGDAIYDRIERGEVPYVHEPGTSNEARYGLSRRLEWVMTPELEALFLRTLGEKGRKQPRSRPSMRQWRDTLEEACERLLVCGRGHAYLGAACPWCTDEERATSKARRWRLRAYRVVYLLSSPESGAEDSGELEVQTAREKIYEMRWSWSADPGGKRSLPVPWKALGRRGLGHMPDSPAFELHSRKGGCTIEKVFDPKLKVKVKRPGNGANPAGMLFTARYPDAEVEFEVAEDE